MHVIASFVPGEASQAELEEYFVLEQAAALVDHPGEPAPSRESTLARLTRPPTPGRRRQYWLAREAGGAHGGREAIGGTAGQLTGFADLVLEGEQPSDLAAFDITVHPKHRRRGLATALLREVVSAASARQALLMEGITDRSAGQAWADAQGFAVAQRTLQLTIDLATADRTRWEVSGSPGYRLAHWTGSTPAELLDSYAAARNAITEAPRGDMSFTEPAWTPERVRDEEATAQARGCELRIVVAVHEQSGDVAGLTYLEVYRHQPDLAIQQDTAVLANHRGHGLGAWMKAVNLQLLTADHPLLTRVRTSNAADNTYMLRVNRQVGFAGEVATEIREAKVAHLASRLAATQANPS